MAAKRTGTVASPWKGLRHARGAAKDTPAHLERLSSADDDERDEAYESLHQTLYSNEKFYGAAALAVPILLELVTSDATPERHRALDLVTNILCTGPDNRLEFGLDLNDAGLRERYLSQPAASIYEAVCSRAELWLRLLDSPDPRLRANAARLLGYSFDVAERASAALSARVEKEPDELVAGTQLVALGMLARYSGGGDVVPLLERLAHSQNFSLESFALLAQRYLPSAVGARPAVPSLVALLSRAPVDGALFPYASGDIAGLAAFKFAPRDAEERALFREALLAALERTQEDRGQLAWLLPLEFEPSQRPRLAEELSDEQRGLCARLSGFPLASNEFLRYGLAFATDTRRRWLGLDAPGLLERRLALGVAGLPEQPPLWASLREKEQRKEGNLALLAQLAEQLSPEELGQLYGELHIEAYGLKSWLFDVSTLATFMRERGRSAVPLARKVIEFGRENRNTNEALNAALRTLLEHDQLPADASASLQLAEPWEETHAILRALPLEQREQLLLEALTFAEGKHTVEQLLSAVVETIGDAPTQEVKARVEALRRKYASEELVVPTGWGSNQGVVQLLDLALARCRS